MIKYKIAIIKNIIMVEENILLNVQKKDVSFTSQLKTVPAKT